MPRSFLVKKNRYYDHASSYKSTRHERNGVSHSTSAEDLASFKSAEYVRFQKNKEDRSAGQMGKYKCFPLVTD